jgi:hypothetical protein
MVCHWNWTFLDAHLPYGPPQAGLSMVEGCWKEVSRLVHPRIGTDEMATTTDITGIKTHALHRQPTSYLPTRLRHKVPGSDYGNNPFSTIEILP